jgi:flagellar biosynthetic protein FliR
MNGLLFLANIEVYFLVFTRIFMIMFTAPLISSEGIPAMAKVGLGLATSSLVFPMVLAQGWSVPATGLGYVALLVGEGIIGMVIGFFLQIAYAGFQTAGQFFAVQVGFSASTVFDPLSQEELPVLGQFYNLIAMFVFVVLAGLNRIFMVGVYGSFLALNTVTLARAGTTFVQYLVGGLARLFQQALSLAMPIFGTLFVVSVTMGLLAKAAPQLNLMSMGFSVNILLAFFIMVLVLPILLSSFNGIIDASFRDLADIFLILGGQVPAPEGGL